ncbi:MAG: ThiF family adenylyltransferase [Thermoplasmatota archaeon]
MTKETGTHARIAPLVDLSKMSKCTVAIIGAGMGGSRIATELCRCGVGGFILFDSEPLSEANVSRHVGGISSVGVPKVAVVGAALRQIDAEVRVSENAFDLDHGSEGEVEGLIRGSQMIIEATGRQTVAERVSKMATRLGIPAVFGGVYPKGIGGFVLGYEPGKGDPCYSCVAVAMRMQGFELPRGDAEFYDEARGADELVAEPCLSLNAWYIDLLQTRLCLQLLEIPSIDPDNPAFSPMPGKLIIWGNRPWDDGFFTQPLRWRLAAVERNPGCAACSPVMP